MTFLNVIDDPGLKSATLLYEKLTEYPFQYGMFSLNWIVPSSAGNGIEVVMDMVEVVNREIVEVVMGVFDIELFSWLTSLLRLLI